MGHKVQYVQIMKLHESFIHEKSLEIQVAGDGIGTREAEALVAIIAQLSVSVISR